MRSLLFWVLKCIFGLAFWMVKLEPKEERVLIDLYLNRKKFRNRRFVYLRGLRIISTDPLCVCDNGPGTMFGMVVNSTGKVSVISYDPAGGGTRVYRVDSVILNDSFDLASDRQVSY